MFKAKLGAGEAIKEENILKYSLPPFISDIQTAVKMAPQP